MSRHHTSRFIEWGGHIIPRVAAEMDLNPPAGTCPRCGGLGVYPESIDSERFDVMVPCVCRVFCRPCKNWVNKSGHTCKGDANVASI